MGLIARVMGDRVAGIHGGATGQFENLFSFEQSFMDDDSFEEEGFIPTATEGMRTVPTRGSSSPTPAPRVSAADLLSPTSTRCRPSCAAGSSA